MKGRRRRSSDPLLETASIQKRNFNFFKIFCPQTCSLKMEIPISNMESERRVLPSLVILRNRLMKAWSTEIIETGDGLFFQNGWAKFVEDNSFTNGDRMIFNYVGDGVFDVIVYDPSGCEKIIVAGAQAQVIGLKENDGDDNSQDTVLVELSINSVAEDVKKDEEMEGAEDDDDEDHHHTHSKGKKRHNTGGSKRAASAKKSVIPEHFGADLFRSGRYAQPANAYFVTKLSAKMRDDLHIPTEVIKDYNIQFPPNVILRDPRGREWTTNVNVWGDRRTWLTGGWRSLCLANGVEKEDRCICEFLPQSGTNMVLQVTIVRG